MIFPRQLLTPHVPHTCGKLNCAHMRIAMFTSNRTTIPPAAGVIAASAYLTGLLADGLIQKGHDVTLYAAKGSVSKARIRDLDLQPSKLDYALNPAEWVKNLNLAYKQLYISELYRYAADYDIVHLQTEPVYLGMPMAASSSVPTIVTNHNRFIPDELPILNHYPGIPIVCISKYQQGVFPSLNHLAVIYDGIETHRFPFVEKPDGDYLLFMGRLVAAKGPAEAAVAAKASGRKLKISGVGEITYIEQHIKPACTGPVEFLGPVPKDTPAWYGLYGNAKALLSPIQWEEPFGLVFVESMATGTPVIAYSRGSVPELIRDGETGFIVNSSDDDIRGEWIVRKTGHAGLLEAIERLYDLSEADYLNMRQNCRQHVTDHFGINTMIENYVSVYEKAIHEHRH